MAGLIVGIVEQDNILTVFYWVVGILAIFVPIVVTLGIVGLFQRVKRHRLRTTIRYSVLTGLSSILSLILILATVCLINRWKIDAAESYVSRAVPVLDQIKAQSGAYPSRLPTELIGEPPSLLRDYGTYTATPGSFCFEYINEPAGWAGGEGALKFESSTRKWIADR